MKLTYSLFAPVCGVPDDVVAPLVGWSKCLGNHHLVLGEPDLKLLVPSPVATRP